MTAAKTAPKNRASSTAALPTAGNSRRTGALATAKKSAPSAQLPLPALPPVAPRLKQKLVRDSFTIPKPEYTVLDALKLRAANLMRPTKKSEVLRAGIFALNAMNDRAFLAALNSIPSLKTGRPKNVPTSAPAPGSGTESP